MGLSSSELNNNLESIILYKSYSQDNVSVPAGSSKTISVNAPVINGYARTVWSIYCENASSGGVGVSYSSVWGSSLDGDHISVGIRNHTSNNAIKIKVKIRMLYIKDGFYGES